MNPPVYVVGVGMTKFERPQTKSWDYMDMGREAGTDALKDSGLSYQAVQAVIASYCYGEPTCGQRAVYELGLTGVPVFNVNNNCSSGSSALMLAATLVKSGYDCVLALGFEKMERGLSQRYSDKEAPTKRHMDHLVDIGAEAGLVRADMNHITSDVIKLFAYGAREYMQKYPECVQQDFVDIAFKNRHQGASNKRAAVQSRLTSRDVLSAHPLCYPITAGMSAPTADGGAAAVLCSRSFVEKQNIWPKAVEIIAQHMVTDLPSSFSKSFLYLSGYG